MPRTRHFSPVRSSMLTLGMAPAILASFSGVALPVGVAMLTATAAIASDEAVKGARLEPSDASTLEQFSRQWREWTALLADPFFEGRGPGLRGNTLAAEMLEFHMKRAGLEPLFGTKSKDASGAEQVEAFSSFRQAFPYGQKRTPVEQSLAVKAGDVEMKFVPGVDFNVLGMSGKGNVTGPLAFAGYALPKVDGQEYNSFTGEKDLEGKIAIVLRFEPMTDEGKSKLQAQGWSPRAGLEPKLRAAQNAGASAIILVNPPGADDPRVGRLENAESIASRTSMDVSVIMMSIEAADRLVKATDAQGRSLLDLRKAADNAGGVIDLPKAQVSLAAAIERSPSLTENVGGVLRGRGALADEYIVIGAHFDHLGYGGRGSRDATSNGQLHPGADDNASGTSGMLLLAYELAEAYKAAPADEPARSIIFLGFCAEEMGLIGSRYYVNNPPIEIGKHALMVNLDMIGRLRQDKLEVTGVGTAEGLEAFVTPYFENSGLKISARKGGMGPSDHQAFFDAGVPVLFFFTGLHGEYHLPTDVASLLNPDGAARIVDLVKRIVLDAAVMPERMAYTDNDESRRYERPGRGGEETPAGPTAVAPPASGPEAGGAGQGAAAGAGGPAQGPGPGMASMRVRFGISPGDYSGSEPGVLVGDVFPATSAADAGLKAGDLMTHWNGERVTSVEEWMPMLGKHNPGDKVKIKFRRDGQEMETEATLKGRARSDQ